MVSGLVAGTTADAVQPRSSENKASSTVATSVGNSTMRPAASQAASAEPIATEIEKMVRNSVTTCSPPPKVNDTSGGNSDSTSAPTSQNQLATMAPHHSRGSARTCLISDPVEAKIFGLMCRPGAPSVVFGMSTLESQLASEVKIISQAK